MNHAIFSMVDTYIGNLLIKDDPTLEAIEQSAEDANLPPMSISPHQGKFLQVLAQLCRAKSILEIGSFVGYSTVWLARSLPEDGSLVTLEFDPFHAGIAKKNLRENGMKHRVDLRIGRGLDLLPIIRGEIESGQRAPFDMIFIDADKPPYLEYFDWAVQLSRPGGLIVCDNVIREGKVLDAYSTDEKVLGVQRLNKSLSTDTRVTATIITTVGIKDYDGMVIAVVN